MKYQLAIFDLDGTVLDTLEDLAGSTNYALSTNGCPRRTVDAVRRFVGNGIRNLILRAVPGGAEPDTVERVFHDFQAHYREHSADRTRPYPGIPELLQELRQAGMKTAVVSNKADFAVQDLCRKYFPGMFDFAVGEREGIARKPAPDSVYEVLSVLGVAREDAVYIGDSEVDVALFQNAEMDGSAVTWGFREKEILLERGAKTFAGSCEELKQLLIP